MDINVRDYRENFTTGPEKMYTQDEVDELLNKKEAQATVKQKRVDRKTVASLVKKSNRILISLTTHAFPLDLFPDIINIEEGRITVINRHWWSSEVHSVDIQDISNVFINTMAFFSQLVIISKTFEENEIKIRYLRTNEAVYARRIIEGLRTFENKHIDTALYSTEELIAKLAELSTTEIVM